VLATCDLGLYVLLSLRAGRKLVLKARARRCAAAPLRRTRADRRRTA
jgi:hypothetical protein